MLNYRLGYYWKHPIEFTKEIVVLPFNETKYFIQRGRRGWSDRDNWDLNHHLSFILSKALLDLANKTAGHPCRVIDENNFPECCKTCNCQELWDKELRENAEKFRLLYLDEFYEIKPMEESWKQEEKTQKEATEWLAKWYGYLWN